MLIASVSHSYVDARLLCHSGPGVEPRRSKYLEHIIMLPTIDTQNSPCTPSVFFQKKAESTKHPSTVESLAMFDNCKTMSRPLCTPSGDGMAVLSPLIAINIVAAIELEFSFETMLLNISRSSETMLPNSLAASSTNGTRIESRLPFFGWLIVSSEWK